MGAVFSLLVVYIRVEMDEEDLGLTTSSSVFLMSLVGLLVGYGEYFSAVAITFIGVFLLAQKKTFQAYTKFLNTTEIADAVALGILALVLYPILPQGAVDPYGVLFLRKALLFVIFILLVQFAAFVALKWADTLGFLLSTALSGVVSSLAAVSTMAHAAQTRQLEEPAYAGSVAAVVAMVARNGIIAAVLAPATVPFLTVPLAVAVIAGSAAVLYFCREQGEAAVQEFEGESPFSFTSAFKFGAMFLAILMVAEVAKMEFAVAGSYGAAFLGGFASSTAVVASAATLLAAGAVTPQQAAGMIVLGIVSSLGSKILYTEWGGAHDLTRNIAVPYGVMALAVLSVFLL